MSMKEIKKSITISGVGSYGAINNDTLSEYLSELETRIKNLEEFKMDKLSAKKLEELKITDEETVEDWVDETMIKKKKHTHWIDDRILEVHIRQTLKSQK